MKRFFNSILMNKDEFQIYPGDIVDLKYRYEVSELEAYDGIPTIYYEIVLHNTNTKVGEIDLRLKMNEKMYFYGHVGYNIIEKYRGHNYSYHACRILFTIAKNKYHLNELILTCNPDNVASYKTLLKLNGELVEVAQVPRDHELYKKGDRMKCVFCYKMKI